jgi:hypothetical protein
MKKIVGVRFRDTTENGNLSAKTYSYFTDIEDIEVGDWVVVVVNNDPVAAMVTANGNLSEAAEARASKWIAQKINLTAYNDMVKKQALITTIEKELDLQMRKAQRYEMFKICAKTSPKMQQLLKQLSDLDPTLNLLEE